MGEWGMGECECGRSHPERAEGAHVIPSERSESRDLHFGPALFNGRNADFPGCTGQSRICSVGADRSLRHTIKEFEVVDGYEG